ncbi:YdeI/OmpD-associated family protein [Saccharophagus degradans]|uniref:DUF1905 domain-containing protein n=1 Tax=Saccharophagus degradans (strain 2-40 / ATCC 43961 / DSM 17024) TaxID=203122 RepID=Q21G54_SACD2|nr:YdeI/OmpD-associated family protein [Saccharophagus degradans]ABD82325.1 conserved hypothetical protein [Saccharophagus degradans 2-40]
MSITFKAKLCQAAGHTAGNLWAFIVFPKSASDKLPRRGRTSVEGTINGHAFSATLQPDGKLSHWLQVDGELLQALSNSVGKKVDVAFTPVATEPEPQVPEDLSDALAATPAALENWQQTTVIARVDWIHWVESAKQAKTRVKRIANACDMLASGKRRVCCFDQSGFYSKALCAPKEA